MDSFEDGAITDCQVFMNSAVTKYNKIISKDGAFNASTTSVQEDIVAMLAKKTKTKTKTKNSKRKREDDDDDDDKSKASLPPWIKHWQHTVDGVKVKYKVGDSKKWQGETWYFCDYPNHRDRAKWHTHSAETCRTRKRWLKNKKKITANEADIDNDTDEVPSDTSEEETPEPKPDDATSSASKDVTSLLATALNLLSDNPQARDLIADAINAAQNM